MNVEDRDLIEECRTRSIELLRANLSPAGILAAEPTARARERGYAAIFGRDAAICAIGMELSGDRELQLAASRGLELLVQHQAKNGQIAKFVDTEHAAPDFWYLGCIDSTLWWLIALVLLDIDGKRGLKERYEPQILRALQWLEAQEHQRFYLLQQNEASDWADIMPRSGFVLYTNALWYWVKRLFGLAHQAETYENFNGLFHPFSAGLAEYRRARLLADYALQRARRRDLYLSFVNFSFFGEEGDVFGNVLALLCGLTTRGMSQLILQTLLKENVHEPYPVRVVCEPILQSDVLWRPYMSRHEQNFAWQYHNGGVWPMVGGFWVLALAHSGERDLAWTELAKLARAAALNDWEFNEWLHGATHAPSGMPKQSWNAATFLWAEHTLRTGQDVFLAGD
jgi:glycogen debranching enzyme